MEKNPVKQENAMSCGVACVAFVLNIRYQKALKLFENAQNAEDKGFYCREIVEALEKKNLDSEYKYIKNPAIKRLIYKDDSIVYLRRSKKYPMVHYLCRWNTKWMDSWINFPDEDRNAGFRKRLPGKPIYVIFTKT